MPGKQLLHLLAIVVTFSASAVHFNHQSALAMSPKEVSQQRGRETAQANFLQSSESPESLLSRCLTVFIIGGHIIYSRKKRQK
jgi:hypothetical protein